MQKFEVVRGVAAPLFIANINTDAMMPSIWARDNPNNLGPGLLRHLRFDSEGRERPDFVLNKPKFRNAAIFIGGINFGCGSSRETAVWGLVSYGVRAVIAPSFGEIFRDNAFQNGILTIELPLETVERFVAAIERADDPIMTIDLIRCVVEIHGEQPLPFSISPDRRTALLEGIDETLLLMRNDRDISAFQRKDRVERPWIYFKGTSNGGIAAS